MSEEQSEQNQYSLEQLQHAMSRSASELIQMSFAVAASAQKGFTHTAGVVYHKEGEPEKGTAVLLLNAVGPAVADLVKVLRDAGVEVKFESSVLKEVTNTSTESEQKEESSESEEEPAT